MDPSALGRTEKVARFFVEWLLIATLPITIPVFISKLVSGKLPPAWGLCIALCGYALALIYAFVFRYPAGHLQGSPSAILKVFGVLLPTYRMASVIALVVIITITAVSEVVPLLHDLVAETGLSLWALMIAIIAVVVTLTTLIAPDPGERLEV